MTDPITIVGGSLAGYKAAEELRVLGHDGPITLIGDETGDPYDRPPLSKSYLKPVSDPDDLQLFEPKDLTDLQLDVVSGTSVDRIDTDVRRVFAGPESFGYDRLLITTGRRARRPLWYRDIAGVHVLRTREDADRLRTTLLTAQHLVVIGGGFIGTEVAATATSLGVPTTLLVSGTTPLTALGQDIADALATVHQSAGVNLRTSVAVREILGGDAVSGVLLDSGEVVECDAVLVSVGAIANDEWCGETGIRHPDGGIMCAAGGRVAEHIWAAGDVVAGSQGHWSTAASQAKSAARGLVGLEEGVAGQLREIPYFWTDQYDAKVQVVGHFSPDRDLVVVDGSLSTMDFVALQVVDGHLTAGITARRPQGLAKIRLAIKRGMSLEQSLSVLGAGGITEKVDAAR